jgi:hypothetical protein
MKELLAKKTQVLSKARALDDLGMPETAQPLWQEAAMLEDNWHRGWTAWDVKPKGHYTASAPARATTKRAVRATRQTCFEQPWLDN